MFPGKARGKSPNALTSMYPCLLFFIGFVCVQQYSCAACETLAVKTNASSLLAFYLVASEELSPLLYTSPRVASTEHVQAFGHGCSFLESWNGGLVIYSVFIASCPGPVELPSEGIARESKEVVIAHQANNSQDCNWGPDEEDRGRPTVSLGWEGSRRLGMGSGGKWRLWNEGQLLALGCSSSRGVTGCAPGVKSPSGTATQKLWNLVYVALSEPWAFLR